MSCCNLERVNSTESFTLIIANSGHWLGPDFALDNSIRTGWSFLPSSDSMNCKVETFNTNDIRSIPKKKSIYVLGTSIQRGIFLSLVDIMLDNAEKEQLSNSVIAKCWGRMLVQKGNLAPFEIFLSW